MCKAKPAISMRTWCSPMSATSQGAFVDITETSHSDISCIIKFGKYLAFGARYVIL